MLVLPRLLYYFSALPRPLPKRLFTELNTLLGELIWSPNRHRVSLTKLFTPMIEGGLGAPNFELYYTAAQLQWPATWLSGKQDPEITQIQRLL